MVAHYAEQIRKILYAIGVRLVVHAIERSKVWTAVTR